MDLAKVAAALADPVRISILRLLANPPEQLLCSSSGGGACAANGVCVCEFSRHLRISQPRASYHLRILKEAGLVTERPRGKWTYYAIEPDQITEFCRRLKMTAGLKEQGGNRE